MLLVILSSCDVHEWPDTPEFVKVHLKLNYETHMTKWIYSHDGTAAATEVDDTYDNRQEHGMIRYIVRTYPASDKQYTLQEYTQEFTFTKDVTEGYDHEMTLELLPGDYNLMVWSDLVSDKRRLDFYNADDFSKVSLQGEHMGNSDYRDAFYGEKGISLYSSTTYQAPDTINLTMKRPLAKFEIVATDLLDFIELKTDDICQYKSRIQYVGFMPNVYSLFTDKPVDSTVGVAFESTLDNLTDSETSMGFDYVFVSSKESMVTVKVGICDNDGTLLFLSESIEVPLKPSYHTIISGEYLMQNAAGGVNINPSFDGNYNLIFP